MDDIKFQLQDLLFLKEMVLGYFKENRNDIKLMGSKRILTAEERIALCWFQASLVLFKKYGIDTDKIRILFDDSTS